MCVVLLLSFWGASISTSFVASVKYPILYVVDVQIIMIKRVYGLSGCHREGLVFLVRPEFLLDVGGAQWNQAQAGRYWDILRKLCTVRTIYHAAKILILGGAASSHPLKYINR